MITCQVCGTRFDSNGEACPGCMTIPTERVAVPDHATIPTDPSSLPVAPPCAHPTCSEPAIDGSPLCPLHQLLDQPTRTAFILAGSWGSLEVNDGEVVTIGRSPEDAPKSAAMLVNADRVSRIHASVACGGGTLTITDRSTNGTTVNGERLTSGVERTLIEGDRIVLGTQVELVVNSA